jgi:Cu+-exporting ATPase
MKTIRFLAIGLAALALVNCKNQAKPEVKTVEVETEAVKELDPNATYAKAEFTIDGMTCAIGCAATIQKKISKMEGVKSATVDFDKKLAMVEYDNAKVTPLLLEETVTNVADIYKVSNMKTVDAFSAENSKEKSCEPGCEKECCKIENKKMVCAPDCKEACCAEKNKA